MSNLSLPVLLRVPAPTQSSLSFCEPTSKDLKRWIARLPKANLGETARQLYQALTELNLLLTPSENRMQLLELLRPEVQFVCKHLERHFLNQAVVLDERPRKVANLCQALQNHLAVGYKLIIERVTSRPGKDRTQLLTTALQRAVQCLNGPLIRANQLYCPVQDGLWIELHKFYQLACQHQVQNIPVSDEQALHTRALTVEQTYVIALLMGCSRCNQMRQLNIGRLADVLDAWSPFVRLQPAADDTSLYAISARQDKPPHYKSLFPEDQYHSLIGLNTQALAAMITRYLETPMDQRGQSPLLVPQGFTLDLLEHLASAWGDVAERTFQRTPGQGTLSVCIGMSALHYHLGGERSFSDMLQVPAVKAAQFALHSANEKSDDPWSNAFDTQRGSTSEVLLPYEEIEYQRPAGESGDAGSNAQQTFPTFELNLINHSPSGYCLAWPKEVPAQLQAGELIGVQDNSGQGWSVAVVRWVRQVRSGGTQMGIELVAPFAQPCGLQLVREEQNSPYMRALLLPEIRAIKQPATLLAPRLPFKVGNNVMINIAGNERRGLLGHQRTSSGSYNQFEYETFEVPGAAGGSTPKAEQEFDSLWSSL
jgi:hypothetical protein